MSKKVKVELVKGAPIHFDICVNGEWITYELVCPTCGNKFWVMSLDKEEGACVDPNCPTVCLFKLKTVADMSKVGWNIPGAGNKYKP